MNSTLLKLETSVLVKIFGYATMPPYSRVKPATQLARWSVVCKKLGQVVVDDVLWRPLFESVFKSVTGGIRIKTAKNSFQSFKTMEIRIQKASFAV